MIIGAIFFAFVAACALVLFVAIVKSTIDDTRAIAGATPQPSHTVIFPGERTGRFDRTPAPTRTGRFDRQREGQRVTS